MHIAQPDVVESAIAIKSNILYSDDNINQSSGCLGNHNGRAAVQWPLATRTSGHREQNCKTRTSQLCFHLCDFHLFVLLKLLQIPSGLVQLRPKVLNDFHHSVHILFVSFLLHFMLFLQFNQGNRSVAVLASWRGVDRKRRSRRGWRVVRRPNRSTIITSWEGQSLVDPMLGRPGVGSGSLCCRRLRSMATLSTLCLGVAELDLELGSGGLAPLG